VPLASEMTTRRTFLQGSSLAFSASLLRAAGRPLRIGVTDWNLHLDADPAAVGKAAKLGFQGVQISLGRKLVDGKLPLDNAGRIAEYKALAQQYRITLDATCLDRLHDNGLKSDPLAPRWVADSIRITHELGIRVILVPFFGRWALKSRQEMDYVGDALRDLAPEAEKAGVILGLEDTISAEDNVSIMERSRSSAVLVYYDVGNSTLAGFDVVKEIRWLGKDRICQFHFKDNPHYLGEGTIQFPPIVQAIHDIGWSGWANLETDAHPATLDADMRRNLGFIEHILDQQYR
jgi:L-ribulose-5-phosphate 3-epimerase